MFCNWDKPEQAPPYDLAIRNGSMVHARNQHDQKWSRSSHVLPSITCGIWFHGSYSNKREQKRQNSSHANPPTVLLNNGSIVHNQAITNKNSYDHFMCRPPYSFARDWFHGS